MSGEGKGDDGPKGGPNSGSVSGLVMQVAWAALRLLQGEFELRKAEARETTLIVIRALVIIVIGVVLAVLGLGQLVDAGHALLVMAGLTPLWASVVGGLSLCVIAAGLIWWQLHRIRRARFLARMQIFAEGAVTRSAFGSAEDDRHD